MRPPTLSPQLLAVTHGLALVAGLSLGWALWHPRPGPVETYAPPVRQADSSAIFERIPNAVAKPKMQVPRGDKPVRVMQVISQVKPDTSWHPDTAAVNEVVDTFGDSTPVLNTVSKATNLVPVVTCPPDTIDLALVRQPDHTERVIAKSRHGQIVGGVDIPVEHVMIPRAVAWAAGPIYNVGASGWGGAVTREVGPLQVLGAITQQRMGGVTYLVGALVRF